MTVVTAVETDLTETLVGCVADGMGALAVLLSIEQCVVSGSGIISRLLNKNLYKNEKTDFFTYT